MPEQQQQIINWLKEDINSVKTDVKEINAKVDEMLKFKWQIVSGSVVISAIASLLLQIFLNYWQPSKEPASKNNEFKTYNN